MKRRMLVRAVMLLYCATFGFDAVGQVADAPATPEPTTAPPHWAARPRTYRWLDRLPVAIHRVELDKPGDHTLAVVVDVSASAGTRWLAVMAEVAVSPSLPLADVTISTPEQTYRPVGIGYGSGTTMTTVSGLKGSMTTSLVPEFYRFQVWPHSKYPAVTFNPTAGHWVLLFKQNPDKSLNASGVACFENVKKSKDPTFMIFDSSNALAMMPPEKKGKGKDTAQTAEAPITIWLLYEIAEKDASADSSLQFAVDGSTKSPLPTSN